MWDDKQFVIELESLGEPKVRATLARNDGWAMLENRRGVAQEWLRSKDEARAASSAAQRAAREERMVASAEAQALAASKAATAAFEQARWAKWAAVIATIAALIATKEQIIAVIFGHP